MAVKTIKTHLREFVPLSVGNLREALTGDASPGVDSPAEKQELAFWESVLETLNKHGHDYKAAVSALRESAKLRIEELTESDLVKELRRQRRHPVTAADAIKSPQEGRRATKPRGANLTEAAKPLREYPQTQSRFVQALRHGA